MIFTVFTVCVLLAFLFWIACPQYSHFDKRLCAPLLSAEDAPNDVEAAKATPPKLSCAARCFQKSCCLAPFSPASS